MSAQFENLPDRVKTECIRKSYAKCTREIRNDLSNIEQARFNNMKLIMKKIEDPWNTVFLMGAYPAFLERIISRYECIFMFVMAGLESLITPSSIFEILKQNKKECNIKNLYRRGFELRPICLETKHIIFFRIKISFADDEEINLDIGLGFDVDYKNNNRIENIFRILDILEDSVRQTALPANSDFLFRNEMCKKKDVTALQDEENNQVLSYGNPSSLMFQCAKYLEIL